MKLAIIPLALVGVGISSHAQTVTKQALQSTPAIAPHEKVEWADLDGDADPDAVVFYSDYYSPSQSYIKVFKNQEGTLAEQTNALNGEHFEVTNYDFGDYDADGDIDFMIIDYQTLKILNNQGNFVFDAVDTQLTNNATGSSIYWEDIDGDLDLDLVFDDLIYQNIQGSYSLSLYKMPVASYNRTWLDINNDGLLDMLAVQGQTAYVNPLYLFINEGGGKFVRNALLSQAFSDFGFLIIRDFDIDGDVDITLSELDNKVTVLKNKFKETGELSFLTERSLLNLASPKAAAADLNHDGLTDLIVNGQEYPYRNTYLYINTSDSDSIRFSKKSIPLESTSTSSFSLLDLDGDNTLELYLNGWEDNYSTVLSHVVSIDFGGSAIVPPKPVGLATEIKKEVKLLWSYAGTNSNVTFNLELKRNGSLYSPAHTSSNGTLIKIGDKNFTNDRSILLHSLPAGDYEWRIQAVSASFQTSEFSAAESFTILAEPTALMLTELAYNKVQLNWVYAGTASKFAVFRSSDNYALTEIAVIPSTQQSYIDDKTPANEHFEYYIKAKDGDTYSAKSNAVKHYSSQFTPVEFGRDEPNIISALGAAADFDNDGDYDLGFAGRIDHDFGNSISLINDGSGNLVPGVFLSTAPYGEGFVGTPIGRDMDNDGDTDVVILTGDYSSQKIKVFRNDNSVFTSVFETEPFLGIWQTAVEDFNRDGRIDILYSHTVGNSPGNPIRHRLLLQKANKSFEHSLFEFFPEGAENPGPFTLVDINQDQFTDILFGGTEYKKPTLFINQRGMTFALTPFESASINSFVFADLDGDGKVDMARIEHGSSLFTYAGDGSLNFTNAKETKFGLVSFNADIKINLADINMDGLPDLVLNDNYRTYLLNNLGDFNFILASYDFEGNWGTSVFLTDMERDGDLDFVKLGNDYYHQGLNLFYLNKSNNPNAAPSVPTGIVSNQKGNEIVLQWQPSTDDHSPSPFLSYNVEIRKQGGEYFVHPETDLTGTFRRRLGPGNAGHDKKFIITELQPGNYTARVQALDAAFKLSGWSSSYAFTVHQGPTNLTLERLLLNKIKLTWMNAPAAETKVIVERQSVDSEFEIIAELAPGSTQYIDNDIEYNKLYTYRVYEQVASATTASSNYVNWNSSLFVTNETTITNVFGSLDVADYNSDGKMDLLVNGGRIYNGYTTDITKAIYEYTTSGWIKRPVGSSVIGHTGSLIFIDINADHLPDIWEYGYIFNSGSFKTEIFSNSGNETFLPVENILTAGNHQLLSQLDLDNNNAPDYLALPSYQSTGANFFRNEGGVIEPIADPFPPSGIIPADFDNDGDEDFFKYSYDGYEFWMNNKGVYTRKDIVPFIGYSSPLLQSVDYDGDNFPDLVFGGDSYSVGGLLKNLGPDENGNLHFQKLTQELPKGAIHPIWADYDHDGDLDSFIPGRPSLLFLNEGNDSFSTYSIPGFSAISDLTHCRHIDFDADGDLDIYLSGYVRKGDLEGYDVPYSFVLNNQLINGTGIGNQPPGLAANLRFHQDIAGVHLNWDAPTDDHTPQRALTYDVVLYKDNKEYLRGPVNPLTGMRYKLVQGTAPSTLLLNNLPIGNYTWKVQAIDQSFAGSAFSTAGELVILPDAPNMNDTLIYRCDREISLSAQGQNIEWFTDEALTNKIASGIFHPQSSQVMYVTQTIDGMRGVARKVNITIFDRPEKPKMTTPNPYTFCESMAGHQIYLAGEGIDMRWYTNATLTTLRATGNMISATAISQTIYATQKIGGCESLPQEVHVAAIEINSTITYIDGMLSVGEENANYYQWYKNGIAISGANSKTLAITEFATYQVVIAKNAICSETSAPFLVTGIEEQIDSLEIYPNPATNKFVVNVPPGHSRIEIYDSFGRFIYSAQSDGESLEIQSSSWKSGMYMITLTHDNKRTIRKILIN